jgi:Arc/MetJ family transcription regulator
VTYCREVPNVNVPVEEGLHRRVRAAMALEGKRLYEFVDDALRAEVERVEAKHGISRPHEPAAAEEA